MSKRISLSLAVLLLAVSPALFADTSDVDLDLRASDGKKHFEVTASAPAPPPPAAESYGALFSKLGAMIRIAIAVRGY